MVYCCEHRCVTRRLQVDLLSLSRELLAALTYRAKEDEKPPVRSCFASHSIFLKVLPRWLQYILDFFPSTSDRLHRVLVSTLTKSQARAEVTPRDHLEDGQKTG